VRWNLCPNLWQQRPRQFHVVIASRLLVTFLVLTALIVDTSVSQTAKTSGSRQAPVSGDLERASLDELLKRADSGDARAMCELGSRYAAGASGSKADDSSAFSWFRKAADQGLTEAQYRTAMAYLSGRGVKQDYSESAHWLREAANSRDSRAQGVLANLYYSGRGVPQDYSQAYEWSLKAAEQGNSYGQFLLGTLYVEGKGTVTDKNRGVEWLTKAANSGFPEAQVKLAALYQLGDGFEQDYGQALLWYTKAAANGDHSGELGLGTMYSKGLGVARDCSQAALWFQAASEGGNATAGVALAGLYFGGKGVQQSDSRAVALLQKAAETNNAQALTVLGILYLMGYGVQVDLSKGTDMLRKAAEMGDAEAQFLLGDFYKNGSGVVQDFDQAALWLRRAAEKGNASAETALGTLYNRGLGVPQNDALALEWTKKAVAKNNSQGMRELARLYAYAKVTSQRDYATAGQWFENARIQEAVDKQNRACTVWSMEDYKAIHPNYHNQKWTFWEEMNWKSDPNYPGLSVASVCGKWFNLYAHNERPWLIEVRVHGEPNLPKDKDWNMVLGPDERIAISSRPITDCAKAPTIKFAVSFDAKGDTAKLEYSQNSGLKIKKDHSTDIQSLMQVASVALNTAVQAKQQNEARAFAQQQSQQTALLLQQQQQILNQLQQTKARSAATALPAPSPRPAPASSASATPRSTSTNGGNTVANVDVQVSNSNVSVPYSTGEACMIQGGEVGSNGFPGTVWTEDVTYYLNANGHAKVGVNAYFANGTMHSDNVTVAPGSNRQSFSVPISCDVWSPNQIMLTNISIQYSAL
jgi:TPR repeat protein